MPKSLKFFKVQVRIRQSTLFGLVDLIERLERRYETNRTRVWGAHHLEVLCKNDKIPVV